jgi:hypothetical protein
MMKKMARMMLAVAMGAAVYAQAVDKQALIYNFGKNSGGYAPAGTLVMDAAGNFYGAANEGGVENQCCGTIFELSPKTGGGYSYSVLYTFSGVGDDSSPLGSMVMDSAGNLYGTAAGIDGEIFELSPNGSGGWTETVLYASTASAGVSPSPVVRDGAGNLYGTFEFGGKSNDGYVFELSPNGSGGWTLSHIIDFGGSDGAYPAAGLVLDSLGNLYGTTAAGGGSGGCTNGCGSLFEATPDGGGAWTVQMLYQFAGGNGSSPQAPLVIDASGNLYGVAATGGAKGYGLAFELEKTSHGWVGRTLHNFTDANGDGAAPNTGLVLAGGNLYGTTDAGGGGLTECVVFGFDGCGSAFELVPTGTAWQQHILHDFTGGKDGAFPTGLIINGSGDLFGMALTGGGRNGGVAFELSPK